LEARKLKARQLKVFYFQDDLRLHDYNVDNRVEDFIKAVEDQVSNYLTITKTHLINLTFVNTFFNYVAYFRA
jgi:hypothetical protein